MLDTKQKKLCEILLNHKEAETLRSESDAYFLYNLSPIRQNLIEWIDFKKTDHVLELGSRAGLFTDLLCRRAGKVDSVETDSGNGYVNRIRNTGKKNLTVYAPAVENPLSIEGLSAPEENLPTDMYDYAIVLDPNYALYEYLKKIASDFPEAAPASDPLTCLMSFSYSRLKPGGTLVLAAYNRFSLSYFAGKTDPGCLKLFSSIEKNESEEGEFIFSANRISTVLSGIGFSDIQFYYPVPDHSFPTQIFSDKHLPNPGDVRPASTHYRNERYQFFDEKKAFDAICEDGLFKTFANSYMILAEK